MEVSSGIMLTCRGSALLCLGKNFRWDMWMPPKGHIEDGETWEDAAIRETEEEIGIRVKKSSLKKHFDVMYSDKKGKDYKQVRIFVIEVEHKDLERIDLGNGVKVVRQTLQIEEIQAIRWMDAKTVNKMCFWRYRNSILKLI